MVLRLTIPNASMDCRTSAHSSQRLILVDCCVAHRCPRFHAVIYEFKLLPCSSLWTIPEDENTLKIQRVEHSQSVGWNVWLASSLLRSVVQKSFWSRSFSTSLLFQTLIYGTLGRHNSLAVPTIFEIKNANKTQLQSINEVA